MPDDSWSWRRSDTRPDDQARLLYEPGHWGDMLKGTWAILLSRHLARRLSTGGDSFRYLDPFAGAPSYPLGDAARERLRLASDTYVLGQAGWTVRGELASTASLVLGEVRSASRGITASVWDADERRREAWAQVPDARVLSIGDGVEALADVNADLAVIDPYDAFDRWPEYLPAAAAAAARAPVLIYVLNRSPRGGGHARNYASLRRRLAELHRGALLIGRVPSDAHLPRGFHEVLLLTADRLAPDLERDLARSARRLTCKLSTSGAVESSAPREEACEG